MIIEAKNNLITLSNKLGAKLTIRRIENKMYGWGLCSFYLKGASMGSVDHFFVEDSIYLKSKDTTQKLVQEDWEPEYKASKYEILEKTDSKGTVKFSADQHNIDFEVTVSLLENTYAYQFVYEIKPHFTVKHDLYVSLPFPHSKMQFVQYPYETPVVPPFNDRFSISPRKCHVPFMFGCAKVKGKEYFIGIGYHSQQENLNEGRLVYDPVKNLDIPLQIYFTSRWFGVYKWPWSWSGVQQDSYKLNLIFVIAPTQSDCIQSYYKLSGYEANSPITHPPIKESVKALMRGYKDPKLFIKIPELKGSAYGHYVDLKGNPWFPSPRRLIPTGENMQFAYQLYNWWVRYPGEVWAKGRALKIADFVVNSQHPTGAIPICWDNHEKRVATYEHASEIDKKGFIYATSSQSIAAFNLYRLALKREETEKIDCNSWKRTAIKAMKNIAGKIEPNGLLGRSYNLKNEWDDLTSGSWPLIALDYIFEQTQDSKLEEACEKLEKWTVENFAGINWWSRESMDAGASSRPGRINNDAMDIPNFVSYCIYRYLKTSSKKYLQMAKDALSYYWLCCIPAQTPNCRRLTKGLCFEQDFYTVFDVPFRGHCIIDGLPLLAAITGERFYMEFYRTLIQTELNYQLPLSSPFPAFYIGLKANGPNDEPLDILAEDDRCFILLFAPYFMESVRSPYAYRYVGGSDWNIGLDYDPPFKPSFKPEGPYIVAVSTYLMKTSFDDKGRVISAVLNGEKGDEGEVIIFCGKRKLSLSNVKIEGGEIRENRTSDLSSQFLVIGYRHREPVIKLRIYFS